jgi:hypothetical protein
MIESIKLTQAETELLKAYDKIKAALIYSDLVTPRTRNKIRRTEAMIKKLIKISDLIEKHGMPKSDKDTAAFNSALKMLNGLGFNDFIYSIGVLKDLDLIGIALTKTEFMHIVCSYDINVNIIKRCNTCEEYNAIDGMRIEPLPNDVFTKLKSIMIKDAIIIRDWDDTSFRYPEYYIRSEKLKKVDWYHNISFTKNAQSVKVYAKGNYYDLYAKDCDDKKCVELREPLTDTVIFTASSDDPESIEKFSKLELILVSSMYNKHNK